MISVIVPVYRVEPYLRKCLDSIINQTYRELEIILVDDCSPDNCGEICEEYAKRDDRIQVIHFDVNKGLSAARNRGIKESHGDWIMFVDSDDWVEAEFCEIPLKAAEQNDADMVIFRSREWKNGRIWKRKSNLEYPERLVNKEEAIQYSRNIAWNKMYKRELFSSIDYPEGRVYEDIATTHKLIYSAQRIMMIQDVLYNHMRRKDSISTTATEENRKDHFLSSKEQFAFLKQHNCTEKNYQIQLYSSALGLLFRTRSLPSTDATVKEAENIINSIPGLPKELPIRKRIMLLVWRVDKRLFHSICWICGMKKEKG